MDKDSKFTRDEDGYVAVRTVSAPYSSGSDDKDSMFTRDEDGYVAVRVTGSGGGSGGDQHNLGYYETPEALRTAHPTAEAGDWAIVGATDTVWIWDTDNSQWVDSDQKGQVTSVNNQTGDVTITGADILPSQTGNAGKFLVTDGTDASWGNALTNTATGTNSLTINGTAATEAYGVNIGNGSTAGWAGVAIGYNCKIGNLSTGIGKEAEANVPFAIAIGNKAKVSANYAIQLGGGSNGVTNSDANTMKVGNENGNFEMMSADGTIPTARLTKVNSTITIAVADWNSGTTATKSVTGITTTGIVFVSPDPTDQADYTDAGIICSAQAADSLTFTCDTTPTSDIDVVVVQL